MENVLDIVIVFTTLVAGFLGWRLGVMRTVVPLVGVRSRCVHRPPTIMVTWPNTCRRA